jgi:hypothetical protein
MHSMSACIFGGGKKGWLLWEPERDEVVNQVGVIQCWNREQSIFESKEL